MNDRRFLLDAIELSRNATPSESAYSVGALIVDAGGAVVATGYSREGDAHAHAEQVAIEKAGEAQAVLAGATLYTSLEPCSVRGSEAVSCTQRILDARIPRVVYAMREPNVFVDGHGAETLGRAGVEIVEMDELAQLVAEVNAHLIDKAR